MILLHVYRCTECHASRVWGNTDTTLPGIEPPPTREAFLICACEQGRHVEHVFLGKRVDGAVIVDPQVPFALGDLARTDPA